MSKVSSKQIDKQLFSDIKGLIEETKHAVATSVNSATTLLYWNIGCRINADILNNKRAEYGQEIVKGLSKSLTEEYGKGWSEKQLRHCLRIAETFPEKEIVYALSRQLSWTHLRSVMYIKEALKREFYIEMARHENWYE